MFIVFVQDVVEGVWGVHGEEEVYDEGVVEEEVDLEDHHEVEEEEVYDEVEEEVDAEYDESV